MERVRVYSLTGQKTPQVLTVTLRPGFGIQHNGEHLEGGPHTLPADIAHSLLATNRADLVEGDESPVPVTEPVEQRDPWAENRDPFVRRVRGR